MEPMDTTRNGIRRTYAEEFDLTAQDHPMWYQTSMLGSEQMAQMLAYVHQVYCQLQAQGLNHYQAIQKLKNTGQNPIEQLAIEALQAQLEMTQAGASTTMPTHQSVVA